MLLPHNDSSAPEGAGSTVPQPSCEREAWALLQQWELGAEDVELRVHALRDTAGFAPGTVLLMVANRRERGCRTYLCEPGLPNWRRQFEQDLRAGIFGGTPAGPAGEALPPNSSALVHHPFRKGALS